MILLSLFVSPLLLEWFLEGTKNHSRSHDEKDKQKHFWKHDFSSSQKLKRWDTVLVNLCLLSKMQFFFLHLPFPKWDLREGISAEEKCVSGSGVTVVVCRRSVAGRNHPVGSARRSVGSARRSFDDLWAVVSLNLCLLRVPLWFSVSAPCESHRTGFII